ncbi:MAG: hypothetical protein NC906_04715, partial [Candidatus Omnitrophica bacterium]|nr:hypothetical protein [Candidatus Omnitrophota bacterium]
DWTTNGGILYLGAGTGIYDRFNNPSNIDRYFGITREQFNFVSEPGNDYYGLPSLRAIDSVKFSDSTKSETIEVFCGIQKMKDTTGFKSIASFSDGSPAIVVKKKGRGKIVFSGFFPGITYMRSAVLENRKKEKDFLSDCPPSYPESIRDLFTKIVSDINYVPVVLTDNYLVEANFLEGKNADIIAISNWSGKVVENLELTVNRPVKGKPISTENSIKSVKVLGKQTIVKVSLTGAFDFILLPK